MTGAATVLRPLAWCLGLGAAAASFVPATGLANFVVTGAIGNFGHELCLVLHQGAMGRLLARRSGLVENHVVVQALREAQLAALTDIRQRFDASHAARRTANPDAARFSATLAEFIADQTKAAKTLAFIKGDDLTPQENALRERVLAVLPDAFDQGLATRHAAREPTATADAFAQFRRLVEQAVLAELALTLWSPGETPPAPFLDLFAGADTQDGWFGLYLRAAADTLKAANDKDSFFPAIWAAEQTALIKAIVEAHTALLHDIKSDTTLIRDAQAAESDAAERRHRELLAAQEALRQEIAREKGVDPAVLAPLFTHLGQAHLTLDQMRTQAESAIADMLARAATPVPPSNDGADIAATLAAARAHLGRLDTAAARALLDAHIAEEEAARRQRLLPLLRERAAAERLAYDHAAAAATLCQILALDPDDVWTWIALGDLHITIGALGPAAGAYAGARRAATHLSQSDPGNAQWQHDLGAAHDRIGAVQSAQGDLGAALSGYRAALKVAVRLSHSNPGNALWQRDLSVSHSRIGDVQRAQGDLRAALSSYRAGLEIRARLSRSDPGNAQWQRDLSVSHNKIGDVQRDQGDLGAALSSYRAGHNIFARLSQSDPGNAEWQRDLAASHERLGDIHARTGEPSESRRCFALALSTYDSLAARNPTDHQSRLFSVIPRWRLATLDPPNAAAHLDAALAILEPLAAAGRLDATRLAWIPEIKAERAALDSP